MALYTVFMKPDAPDPLESTEFVKEGFSWLAVVLHVLWALYYRIWSVVGLFLAVDFMVSGLEVLGLISENGANIISAGFLIWLGYEANDFYRQALKKRGYILMDIVSARNVEEAEEKFFARYVALKENTITKKGEDYGFIAG